MQERYELEVKLRDYPDVMTLKELRLVLDGIVRALLYRYFIKIKSNTFVLETTTVFRKYA